MTALPAKAKRVRRGAGSERRGEDSEGEEASSSARREGNQVRKRGKKEDLTDLSVFLPSGFPLLSQKAGLKRRRKLPVLVPKEKTQMKKPPRLPRRS